MTVGYPIVGIIKRSRLTSFGTSYTSPTWASIMNRIVEERIRAGKGPVGFVNPVLYKNAEAMNDVIHGGNGVCKEDDGFECAPGWDPVSA